MAKHPERKDKQQPGPPGAPRASPDIEPLFVRQDDRVGPPQYAVLAAKDSWQILLEYGDRYLRWVMRGAPGSEGPAWPDTDVAAHSLEREGGTLHKPALEREGNETGHFHNVRERDGQVVSMSECLDEGEFELEFDGEIMAGRWKLARSGSPRRARENWTLTRA